VKTLNINISRVLLLCGTLAAGALPVLAYAGLDGEALFEANCTTCHRKGGEGSIGLPLDKKKFSYFTDDYVIKTIRHGRPGRIMPAFPALSDAQVTAIITYLRQWSKTEHKADTNFRTSGDEKNGKQLFAGHCTNCHGDSGRGLGKGTGQSYSRERDFKVVPPAIGNLGFLASVSDGMLKEVITNGIKGTAMPAFSKMGISGQGIDDIIAYLRSLETDREPVKQEEVPVEPTLIVDSPHDFETTVKNVKQALAGYNFRVFPDRYIEQGLFPEWEANKKQLTIRYCNFNELYDMLRIDPRLGIGLPCRITVVENDKGQVQLIAMNMSLIARLFNNAQLEGYARDMSERQRDILDEATL